MIAADHAPSRRDLAWFGVIVAAFFAIVAGLVVWKGGAIIVLGALLAAAWLAAVVLRRDGTQGRVLGAFVPAVFVGAAGAAAAGDPATVALWTAAIGIAIAVVYYAVPPLRLVLYHGWMHAVTPVGWSISHLVLAVAYYFVVTPIGLLLRAFGRDPMQRRLHRDGTTYWEPQRTGTSAEDSFHQY